MRRNGKLDRQPVGTGAELVPRDMSVREIEIARLQRVVGRRYAPRDRREVHGPHEQCAGTLQPGAEYDLARPGRDVEHVAITLPGRGSRERPIGHIVNAD
jgi:hypothetical protein